MRRLSTLAFVFTIFLGTLSAQELPYFVTYSHHMEEPGSLDLETKTAAGTPRGGNGFGATALELEYGTTAWWTSELYLEGQKTAKDSAIFTGFRIENRIRPLMLNMIRRLYQMPGFPAEKNCIRRRHSLPA